MTEIKCELGNGKRAWNNSGTATQCTVIPRMSTDIQLHKSNSKAKILFLILDTMIWSWYYLKGIRVLQNGHQMLWNVVNRTPVFNYVYSVWKVWGTLKSSCHPPFFIRLIVQLFCDSLLTFMKQRESKPKLICTHICRKCLNGIQKQKINWSINNPNKTSHSVQYQLTLLDEFSNKLKQLW